MHADNKLLCLISIWLAAHRHRQLEVYAVSRCVVFNGNFARRFALKVVANDAGHHIRAKRRPYVMTGNRCRLSSQNKAVVYLENGLT